MNLYNRVLGNPFVYNTIRPLVVGGIDLSSLYKTLEVTDQDIVLDVGCGTGDALNYLDGFQQYWGFDIDEVAVSYAKKHFGSKHGVVFQTKLLEKTDIRQIQPSRVVLAGLLHHLSDHEVGGLFSMLASSPNLRRVVTQDIAYLSSELVSNFFAWLDRGRFCRRPREYEALVKDAGFEVVFSSIVRSHPVRGRVKYLIMALEPKR
jgi:cyclopropane fatty-acyl-phospholipid synthase-like methyltransferase